MTRRPVTVAPDTPLSQAAILMTRGRLRHLPVVSGTTLLGIVSARDLARAYPPDVNPFSAGAHDRPVTAPVSGIMATEIMTIASSASIDEAARLLVEHKIGALPVVTDGELVGILSALDVLRAFREIVGGDEPGFRVTFTVGDGDDAIETATALARRHGLSIESVMTMRHAGSRLAVARLRGETVDAFVDALWRSRHRVVTVERETPEGDTPDGDAS